MGPPAVVLDTNVWVAAAFRRGSASARLVAAVRAGRLRPRGGEATRAEAEAVLRRIPGLSWAAVAPLFGEDGRFTGEADPGQFADIPDPADRKFAAPAQAAGVVLVTSDRRLAEGAARAAVPVVTPGECVRGCLIDSRQLAK